jgi:hypothetical protein
MGSLRRRVQEHDVHHWAASFTGQLAASQSPVVAGPVSRVGAMMRSVSEFWRSLRSPALIGSRDSNAAQD